MPSLREYWQGGFRALHIEENISNAFADFAPYAAADEQRVVISHHSSSTTTALTNTAVGTPLGPASHVTSSSAVIMEDSGDFTVQARDANAGCITFSTAGNLQVDASVRVPLPLPRATAASTDERHKEAPEKEEERRALPPHPPVVKPSAAQRRFSDHTRPVQQPPLPSTHERTAAAAAAAGAFGQAEMELTLPHWDANRQSLGARFGPAAVRLTRTFSAAATATATEAATSRLLNSPPRSDDDELARTLLMERARTYQHTIDAALCLALGESSPYTLPSSPTKSAAGDAPAVVVQTTQGDPITLQRAPWALTCGLQFPLDLGDTLVGISLQNDRATSVVLPHPGVQWAVSAAAGVPTPSASLSSQQGESVETTDKAAEAEAPACVACVPSRLFAGAASSEATAAASHPSSYVVIPDWTFRFLLVQTLASHTLVRDTSPVPSMLRDDSGDGSLNTSGATRLASSYDWRRLPTLVGVNVGIGRERLRLSVASIVHDATVDLEVAGVLDMTPWTPRMPTLVKVGYNNVGRFAAGLTTLFYETVTATLGVHVAPGEQAKFGIEVKF